jgi:hypothetical protein
MISVGETLREAVACGAKFRLSGAEVEIANFELLPELVKDALRAYSSYLVALLGRGCDAAPIELLKKLGVTPVLHETWQEVRGAVRQIMRDLEEHGGPLGFDTETAPYPEFARERPWAKFNKGGEFSDQQPTEKDYTDPAGLDPNRADICLAQIYAGGDWCYLFRGEALGMLLRSHWLRRQWLVAHNLGFEVKFLANTGYRLPAGRKALGRLDCSKQAAVLLTGTGFAGERSSLANAAAALLGITRISKALQLSCWRARILSLGQQSYAGLDSVVTRKLWEDAWPKLVEHGLDKPYRLQRACITPVADAERRGMKLDTEAHSNLISAWQAELAEKQSAYTSITGIATPMMDSEVRAWLDSILPEEARTAWPTTDRGKMSVSADELAGLALERPEVDFLIEARRRQKLLNSFGDNFAARISPATGRVHCGFSIMGAKTGRFSSSEPNLQNLPAKRDPRFRRCIIAEHANCLIRADYAQIELRAAAHRYKDAVLTAHLAEGRDIHTWMASQPPASRRTKSRKSNATKQRP